MIILLLTGTSILVASLFLRRKNGIPLPGNNPPQPEPTESKDPDAPK